MAVTRPRLPRRAGLISWGSLQARQTAPAESGCRLAQFARSSALREIRTDRGITVGSVWSVKYALTSSAT